MNATERPNQVSFASAPLLVRVAGAALLALAGTALSGSAVAQQAPRAAGPGEASDPDTSLRRFQRDFDVTLQSTWNFQTGHPRHLFGKPIDLGRPFQSDEDFASAALDLLDSYPGLFGTDSRFLNLREVKHLDLQRIGTSNKVGVSLDQHLEGIPAPGRSISVIFLEDGTLVSLDSHALPGLEDLSPIPALFEEQAIQVAIDAFGYALGEVRGSRLIVTADEKDAAPALAWEVELKASVTDAGVPIMERLEIDAHQPRLLRRRSSVHTFVDLIGDVQGSATPGLDPDTAGNPPALMFLHGVPVNGPSLDHTDANGNWVIPFGGASPQNVTVDFGPNSRWIRVVDIAGNEISKTVSVTPGQFTSIILNPGGAPRNTSEVNAQYHSVAFRNFIRGLDPTDTNWNFRRLANVNIGASCNAFYDGSSTNYFLPGGPCVNTAYSTVISHETGHWANDIYNSGNGGDGFGEGSSDIWANFIADSPIVGKDFAGPGNHIRVATNNRQYCGSCGAGCYGGTHANGEVLMGAFWKFRVNLNNTHGDAGGDLIADLLMLSWYQVYDDQTICTSIRDHLLVLDDNDGDLSNGTPNGCDIDTGFLQQGFPGFFAGLTLEHTPVAESQAPHSWTEVVVTIPPDPCNPGGTITSVDLFTSTNDGTYQSRKMNPTRNPNEWLGLVPPQSPPSVLKYYIRATPSSGAPATSPRGAPANDRHLFYVGDLQELAFYDFEAANDEGWTHRQFRTQDDWQRGSPAGKAGDPASAHSGTQSWANDLGGAGFNGFYAADVRNRLSSPQFDFTNDTGVRIQFRRWLTIETGQFDQADLLVGNTSIWTNPTNRNLTDNHWTLQEYDVSTLADGQLRRFRFDLESDTSVQFGGWNIDDFRVLSLNDNSTDCASPSRYGTGTPGSGGLTPIIYTANGAPNTGNSAFTVVGERMAGGSPVYLLFGAASASLPFQGATLLVDPTGAIILRRVASGSGTGGGRVSLNLAIQEDPALVGLDVFAQFLVEDAGAAGGWAASRGLQFQICDG